MAQIFISYARDEDEPFVKSLYEHLTAEGFIVWWDRVSMPSRALTFMQEIRDAINDAERLLLIIGPKALASDYVRAEWQHAMADGKVVVPALRRGRHEELPAELNHLHCPSCSDERPFTESLSEIVRLLRDPIPALGTVSGDVPDLPPHFQPRTAEMSTLADQVFRGITDQITVTGLNRVIVLHGMGGIGKSVLAAAFARSVAARRVFFDGIIWLSARDPETPPLVLASGLGRLLSGGAHHYVDAAEAQTRLTFALKGKTLLCVLDNIWNIEEVEPILGSLDTNTRVILTTRQADLITGGRVITLAELSERSALQHLADWLNKSPDELPIEANELARECGYLPFALALNGALLAEGQQTWSNLLGALRDADLRHAERRFLNYPYPSVLRSIQVSVDALNATAPAALARYCELAAFDWDAPVPEAAIAALWKHSGGISERETRKIILLLHGRSLLRFTGNISKPSVALHDLILHYLRDPHRAHTLNELLIEAYWRRCESDWPSGPSDGYFHQHLVRHLALASRREEIHRLLALDASGANAWYVANEAVGNTSGFLRDLDLASGTDQRQPPSARADSVRAAVVTDHNSEHLGLEFRYALMAASVRSLASTVPPPLLARAVEAGLWSPQRALMEANQAADPSQRVESILVLLRYLDENDKTAALTTSIRAAHSISNPGSRAEALAQVVPHLAGPERTDLIAEALNAAHSITDANFAPPALLSILPYLGGEDRRFALSQALSATQVTGPAIQAAYFARLVPYLEPAHREVVLIQAFDAVARLPADWRAGAMTLLIPLCTGPRKERLVAEAISLASGQPETPSRIEALASLAQYLNPELLLQVRSEATGIQDAATRVRVLMALLPTVTDPLERDEIIRGAVQTVRTITDSDSRRRALALVAPYLSELLPNALAAARAIRDDHMRVQALAAILPSLREADKHAILSRAVTAARSLEDARARVAALIGIVPQLDATERHTILAEALQLLRSTNGTDWQWEMLVAVAPHLEGALVDDALLQAFAVPDSKQRHRALTALAPYLADTQIDRVLAQARGRKMADSAARDMIAIIPSLRAATRSVVVTEALATVHSIEEPEIRAELLLTLLPHADPKEREVVANKALEATMLISNADIRAKMVAALASYLPDRQVHAAVDLAWQMPEPHSWADALTALLPRLPQEERAVHMREALRAASTIRGAFTRATVLADLASATTDEPMKRRILTDALAAAVEETTPEWQSGALASIARHITGELVRQALDVARNLTDMTSRARWLVALSREISDAEVSRIVAEQLDTYRGLDAREALTALLPLIVRAISSEPHATGYQFWRNVLTIMSGGRRAELLTIADAVAAMVRVLGRERDLRDCADAVSLTGHWWP